MPLSKYTIRKRKKQAHFHKFGRIFMILAHIWTHLWARERSEPHLNFQVQGICRENFMQPLSARGILFARAKRTTERFPKRATRRVVIKKKE